MNSLKKYIRKNGLNRHPKAKLLALGGVLFSFGLVTSVAVTYAWYTINIMTSIDSLNMRITSEPYEDFALRIELENSLGRLTPENRPDGYTLDDMEYDRDIGLNDVSGMFEEDWLKGANYKTVLPEFKRNYGAVASSPDRSSKATQGYLQTVLWLKATEDCEIYLAPGDVVTPNKEKNEETARIKGRDVNKLMDVTNAVRLSFFSEDESSEDGYRYIIANPGESEVTYYGGLLDMNGDGYYDYVDGKEILYGQYNTSAALNYEQGNGDPEPYAESLRDTFHANHYPGISHLKYEEDDPNLAIAKEKSVKLATLQYDENEPLRPLESICKLKKNEEKRLVLSVYCEGWDRHMTDAIESAAFNIDISFLALIKG